MPLRPPDTGSFEHLLEEVRIEAKALLRLSKYPETEPWWSRATYRFDGPGAGTPGSFGTCYAAPDLAVAFAESVIHEGAWYTNGHYEVPAADLAARHIVRLSRSPRPTLMLADFTGDALKKLGLNNDISAGEDYALPMAWAQAVHDADSRWDGIWYVSRQLNKGHAVALFERSGVKKSRSRRLAGRALDALCDQFGVVAV